MLKIMKIQTLRMIDGEADLEKEFIWPTENYNVETPGELMKYFDPYYFQYGLFPTCNEHMKVPKVKISCQGCHGKRDTVSR